MTSIGSTSSPSAFAPSAGTTKASDNPLIAKKKSAADEFMAFAEKSPAEKMREMVLGELGLTEDDLKAMSPADRAKAEEKIAQRLKERMKEQLEKHGGITPASGNLTSIIA